MYYNVLKTIKYRNKVHKLLKRKWFLSVVLKNHFFFFSKYKYNQLINYTSSTKIRNRCIINGKARSVNAKMRLSRFYLKNFAGSGKLTGVKKI